MKSKKAPKKKFEFTSSNTKKVKTSGYLDTDNKKSKHPRGNFYGKNNWFPEGN